MKYFRLINIDNNNHGAILNEIDNSLKFVIKDTMSNHINKGPIHINIHLDDFTDFNSKVRKNLIRENKSNKKNVPLSKFNWDMLPFEDIFNIYNYEIRCFAWRIS